MKIVMITVGNPDRMTGGYLYHKQVYAILAQMEVPISEIIVAEADAAAQRAAVITLNPSDYDIIMIDALARIAVAPYVKTWCAHTKVIAMVHELPSLASGGVENEFEQLLIESAHVCIAVSREGRARLLERYVEACRIVVANPGCDRLGVPIHRAPAHVLGEGAAMCVAQWIPRKGIDAVLRAWEIGGFRTMALQFYGETTADPDYTAQIWQQINDLRAKGFIIEVLGSVRDAQLRRAYAENRFMILPSRFEGYGMAFAEAIWAGMPVIGYHIPTVAGIVRGAGHLVAVDDITQLAWKIEYLGGDDLAIYYAWEQVMIRRNMLPRWQNTAFAWLDAFALAFDSQLIDYPVRDYVI